MSFSCFFFNPDILKTLFDKKKQKHLKYDICPLEQVFLRLGLCAGYMLNFLFYFYWLNRGEEDFFSLIFFVGDGGKDGKKPIGSGKKRGEGGKKMLLAPLWTQEEKNICATICIGREIWCLLYSGFISE